MEQRNVEKAIDIYARLMMGEEVKRDGGSNRALYEEYATNAEVYEVLHLLTKRLNLNLYEYGNSLYLNASEGNRVFGYSNEELKRSMGLRYNKELYLVYFIMYQILLFFYNDTGSYQFVECVSLSEIVEQTSNYLKKIMSDLSVLVQDEVEENSFRAIALLWDELPMAAGEDGVIRAGRTARTSLTKCALNFMVSQELLMEAQERYYPTGRMRALVENYFEEYRGRLYEILKEEA